MSEMAIYRQLRLQSEFLFENFHHASHTKPAKMNA
jgi:hypothetical protein